MWCLHLCFDPVGATTEATWLYAPGHGSYRKVNSYQHVGVGRGDFIKEDSSFGGGWVPVGKGSGSYIRVQTYQHVGSGHGDYDKEEIVTFEGWRIRGCCVVLFFASLLLLVGALAWVALGQPDLHDVPVLSGVAGAGGARFDCHADLDLWRSSWSESKKRWCCQHESRGCASGSGGFDCNAGYRYWQEGWSTKKQEWCCAQEGRGCAGKSSDLYDCQAGYEDWQRQWTRGQKLWCCTVYQRGCQTEFEGVGAHDCGGPAESWAREKASWCCLHSGRGCKVVQHLQHAQQPRFNCHVDAAHNWPAEKRGWCCAHQQLGCGFNCNAGFSNWQQEWSPRKQHFCCLHHQRGCPRVPHKVPHKAPHKAPHQAPPVHHEHHEAPCSGDESEWGPGKRAFCCEKHHKGCPQKCEAMCSLKNEHHTCRARVGYAARTSFAHEAHACHKALQQVQRECHECSHCTIEDAQCEALPVIKKPPVTKPFDCEAAIQNARHAWSGEKKAWCCEHEKKGCSSFECQHLQDLGSWPSVKQAWCCEHQGNGCKGPTPPHLPPGDNRRWAHVQVDGVWTWRPERVPVPPVAATTIGFDCHDGLTNFVHGWSTSKKHWCCAHQGLACTGPFPPRVPLKVKHQWKQESVDGVMTWKQVRSHVTRTYDCSTGYAHWHAWHAEKKSYCCSHFGKACR